MLRPVALRLRAVLAEVRDTDDLVVRNRPSAGSAVFPRVHGLQRAGVRRCEWSALQNEVDS